LKLLARTGLFRSCDEEPDRKALITELVLTELD